MKLTLGTIGGAKTNKKIYMTYESLILDILFSLYMSNTQSFFKIYQPKENIKQRFVHHK